LRQISLIARAGQTTALVGSSGCGKYFLKENSISI
jgi:ABC-type glutathione transport system ATPase component